MTLVINQLVAGDTLDFVTTIPDYPASDGWILTYALRGPSSIDLIAVAENADYRIQAAAALTANWLPGRYHWTSTVNQSGQRYTIDAGTLTIQPNLSASPAGYDGRSLAQKALADAEAALASYTASKGMVRRYTIGMRMMEFNTSADILALIQYWRRMVTQEGTAEQIAQGLGTPRKLYVRFK